MKRSEAIKILASWAKPEILSDVYSNNYEEWAENLLYTLEDDLEMLPPFNFDKSSPHTDVYDWDDESPKITDQELLLSALIEEIKGTK